MIYLAIALGFLPSFAWLLFYLREDSKHPEPRLLIAGTFILGAVATLLAFYAELHLSDLWSNLHILDYSPLHFLSFSAVEEIAKFAAAYFLVRRSRYFDEPVDAMVYMITAALGFAAVENIGAAVQGWQELASFTSVFHTVTLRFIGATLLHSLSSGLVGFYWARGINSQEEGWFVFEGLIVATLLHAFFNFLIINISAVIVPTMLLLVIGLLVLHDFDKLKVMPLFSRFFS